MTFVGGNLLTWRSQKQGVVALSSAEAELKLIGVVKGLCELLWRKLLSELGVARGEAMTLYVDNKAAIDMSHNPVQHDRTKHIGVSRHDIKQNIESKSVQIILVRSEIADILPKSVTGTMFNSTLDKLGMTDFYIPI